MLPELKNSILMMACTIDHNRPTEHVVPQAISKTFIISGVIILVATGITYGLLLLLCCCCCFSLFLWGMVMCLIVPK